MSIDVKLLPEIEAEARSVSEELGYAVIKTESGPAFRDDVLHGLFICEECEACTQYECGRCPNDPEDD